MLGSFDNIQLYNVIQQKLEQIAKEQSSTTFDNLAVHCTSVLRVLLKRNSTRAELNLKPVYEISLGSAPYTPSRKIRAATLGLLEYACSGRRFSLESELWKGSFGYYSRFISLLNAQVKQKEFEKASLLLPLILTYLQQGDKDLVEMKNLQSCLSSEMLIEIFKNTTNGSEAQKLLLAFVLELNFIGGDELLENIPEAEKDSPFQIEGFEMPVKAGNALIRNLYCIHLYQIAFSDPECKQELLNQLFELLEINPINYFIINSNCNVLYRLIECLDKFSTEKQKILSKIVVQVCCSVGYLPVKELTLIICHLQESVTLSTVGVVVDTLSPILKLNGSWKRNVVELGLIDTLRVYLIGCRTKLLTNSFNSEDVKGLEKRIKLVLECFADVELLPIIVEKLVPAVSMLIEFEQIGSQIVLLTYRITDMCMESEYEVLVFGALILTLQNWESEIAALNILKIFDELFRQAKHIPDSFIDGGGIKCLLLNKIFRMHDHGKHEFIEIWSSIFKNTLKYSPSAAHELSLQVLEPNVWLKMCTASNSTDFHLLLKSIWNTFSEETIMGMDTSEYQSLRIFNFNLLPVLIRLLRHYSKIYGEVTETYLRILNSVLKNNIRNVMLAIKTNALQLLLEWVVEPSQFSSQDFEFDTIEEFSTQKKVAINLISILKELSEYGFTTDNLRTCLADALRDDSEIIPCKNMILNLMLNAIRKENNPCYFSVTSPSSFGYIKIDDFGRQFPPLGGYSITAWIKVQKFDNEPARILTIIDELANEILSIEITKNRNISYKTKKGSVIYDKISVPENSWFHMAFVHHKPVLSNSYVDFYTNGNFQGSSKCGYIARPGSIGAVTTLIGPYEKGSSGSTHILNIGPISMLSEYLLDAQKISIMCALGFDYTGNWQGSWSSYMVGNRQLESKSTKLIEEEVHSPILTQLATFTMSPGNNYHSHMLEIPEDSFLFSISARNEFCNLSSHTQKDLMSSDLRNSILNRGFRVVLNGCYTKLSSEIMTTQPLGFVVGDILSICPAKFIDSIWTLGGCSILLRLIDQSRSSMELYQTFSILAYSVSSNWRSLAELERQQLYELLCYILKKKKEFITNPVLDSILTLVGKPLDVTE